MERKMNHKKIILRMSPSVVARTLSLLMTNNKEVGWYGVIEKSGVSEFTMKKLLVFPQYVTGGSFDTDDQEYIQWRDSIPYEDFKNIRLLGHSHVNMAVFSSGVDDKMQKDTMSAFSGKDTLYFFPIFNKRMEYWCKAVNTATREWYDVIIPEWDALVRWADEANELVRSCNTYTDEEEFGSYEVPGSKFIFGELDLYESK